MKDIDFTVNGIPAEEWYRNQFEKKYLAYLETKRKDPIRSREFSRECIQLEECMNKQLGYSKSKINSLKDDLKLKYLGFLLIKNKSNWEIQNTNGQVLRVCKTKKECLERIENQTV